MKQLFTFLTALFLTSTTVFGQAPVKILFIGNSFTAANDLQGLVHQFFDAGGTPVYTYAYAPGGISVGDVAMGTAAHMNNPAVFALLKDNEWDYVVLQDNQGRFSLDSAKFPNPAASKVIEGHLKIRDSLHQYHPCAKMIWFSGWGFKDIDVEMIDSITVNYRVLNDLAKDVIAPIGCAWKNAILARPTYELWSPDGAHPDITGSYLTAAVIYGTISKRDVSASGFNHTLPVPDALFLKNMAQMTLRDPLISKKSNLEGTRSIEISWTDPQLKSDGGYKEYRWYRGNSLQKTTSDAFYVPSLSGMYSVWAMDDNGYWYKSCRQEVVVTTGIDKITAADNYLSVYPNPSTTVLHINNLDSRVAVLEIYSLTGSRQMSCLHNSGNEMQVDISSLAPGIYSIRGLDKDNQATGAATRFVKQ